MKKLKILILINKFHKKYPKHKHKYDMIEALRNFAIVKYWHNHGNINYILQKLNFKPDFILHYDVAYGYTFAPKITGLKNINIPKGCFVIDSHYKKNSRINYFESNKIDMIFSITKENFIQQFPEYKSKHYWVPFSINPDIFHDYKLKKDINFLLMGLVHVDNKSSIKPKTNCPKGRYPFREAVLRDFFNKKGFVFVPHPGHLSPPSKNLMVNENYAKQLNRSKIFFTSGGEFHYPVAKFFEALACKTLLLAKPNKDILELGFKNEVNFVSCDESDFYDKAMYYIENHKERERIANNGYKFIHKNHTNVVRAKQIVSYIENYLKQR